MIKTTLQYGQPVAPRKPRLEATIDRLPQENAEFRRFISQASFWCPNLISAESAWLEHASFAFWLIEAARPRILVELGTHAGYSYFSFCQAVQDVGLATRCFAVDTWKGDEHAGFYGDDVYQRVSDHNALRYSQHSTLIRSSFDEALDRFGDGTIDIIHLDGRHFYGDVRHDFEAWRPKLSDRGIVLLHDTNVREREFGVYKLWVQLQEQFSHFEFYHGHGLGLLGVGSDLPALVEDLCSLTVRTRAANEVRSAYARLGSLFSARVIQEKKERELSAKNEEVRVAMEALRESEFTAREQSLLFERQAGSLSDRDREISRLTNFIQVRSAEIEQARLDLAASRTRASELEQILAARSAVMAQLNTELSVSRQETSRLRQDVEARDGALAVEKQRYSEFDAILRKERLEAGEALAGIGEENARLAQDNARLTQESAEAERQQAENDAAAKSLADKLVSTQRQLATLAERNIELARSIAASRAALSVAAMELASKRKETAAFQGALSSEAAGKGSLNRRWKALMRRYEAYRQRRADVKLIRASGLFDAAWYLAQYPDVREAGIDPALHYFLHGGLENRDPSPVFHSAWYLQQNPDVRGAGINPLLHFLQFGAVEGRDPNAYFDSRWYVRRHPAVAEAKSNPLSHYLSTDGRLGRDGERFPDVIQNPAALSTDDEYARWIARYDLLTGADRASIAQCVEAFALRPKISILMPVYNTEIRWVRAAVRSVQSQLYPEWELCISDDASTLDGLQQELYELAAKDPRIRLNIRNTNGNISANSNSALALASGDFVALLDADDVLADHALYWVAKEINSDPDVDLIFSDEDKIDGDGRRFDPYFKSDWNPALMLSQNMFCHLGVYRRSLLDKVGGFRSAFDGSQDHDLVLRCSLETTGDRIRHIPRILYHWRAIATSTASGGGAKPYAWDAGRRAIAEHLVKQKIGGSVRSVAVAQCHYQVDYCIPTPSPFVSILIPTTGKPELVMPCVKSLLHRSSYKNHEILLLVNEAHRHLPGRAECLDWANAQVRVRVVYHQDRPFNYSWVNNWGSRQARGDILCFLNDDTEVITSDWLERFAARVSLPGIGAAGAMLYFPDDTIQHAGVILGIGGVACHAFSHLPRGTWGYFSRACLEQDISCVTAGCMAVRKEAFNAIGGFREDLVIAFNDVDLCIRLRNAGWRITWTPTVEFYHKESTSVGKHNSPQRAAQFEEELRLMREQWDRFLDFDPNYNVNLSLEQPFRLAFPPRHSAPY